MKRFVTIICAVFLITSASAQLANLSDEFNRVCSLQEWQNVEAVEGWPQSHLEDYDINTTNEGHLTMVPWSTA